jgi:CheY-like chemotaxis protein
MTRPATVLLVDDNRLDVELTLEVFRDSRLANAINVVSSGEEALEYMFGKGKFADRQNYPLPDLILLDLKMPGLDGFDVLSQVRKTPGIKGIPVIVLTGSNAEGDRAMSFDLGANGYLLKPISFDGLMHAIREVGDYWIVMNVKD